MTVRADSSVAPPAETGAARRCVKEKKKSKMCWIRWLLTVLLSAQRNINEHAHNEELDISSVLSLLTVGGIMSSYYYTKELLK